MFLFLEKLTANSEPSTEKKKFINKENGQKLKISKLWALKLVQLYRTLKSANLICFRPINIYVLLDVKFLEWGNLTLKGREWDFLHDPYFR